MINSPPHFFALLAPFIGGHQPLWQYIDIDAVTVPTPVFQRGSGESVSVVNHIHVAIRLKSILVVAYQT